MRLFAIFCTKKPVWTCKAYRGMGNMDKIAQMQGIIVSHNYLPFSRPLRGDFIYKLIRSSKLSNQRSLNLTWRAFMIAWDRSATCNLLKILVIWLRTVLSLITNFSAIWLFL